MNKKDKENTMALVVFMSISWLILSLIFNVYIGFAFLIIFLIFYYSIRILEKLDKKTNKRRKK